MHIAEIWRYPVKSMAGERIETIELGLLGMAGDRIVHVENRYGRVVTARTHPRLLGLHARVDDAGTVTVDGRAWTDPRVRASVTAIAGDGATLVCDESVGRFDVLPLLIATDGAIAAFGYDGRRLRPNLVIGGVTGLAERRWAGRRLRIGKILVDLADLRARCVMTTVDPDTLQSNPRVLRSIVERFDGTFALDASVARGGRLSEGDPVMLM
jgi:uncharacterized protein YcbX